MSMRVQQCVCFARYARLLSITRKWFPLQGELAPLTMYFLINNKSILIHSMLAAGIVQDTFGGKAAEGRADWRLLLPLLLLVLLPLRLESLPFRLESLPFLSSRILFTKHSCAHGY